MDSLTITTNDRSFYDELQTANITGLEVHRIISTVDCVDPELMANLNKVLNVAVYFSSTVGINLFSTWLYERYKKKPEEKIKINGIEISGNQNEIKVQINNYYIQTEEADQS